MCDSIKCDQGRSRPYGEDGAPEGTAIAPLVWIVLLALACGGALLIAYGVGAIAGRS